MTIAANIAARDRYTAALRGDQPSGKAVVGMTGNEATEALFGWVYKQPGMATLQDCKGILKRVHDERGMDESVMLLQRFGIAATGLDKLWIGMYQSFFDYARLCLYYGISPAYGWTNVDDIPHNLRDRWLLSHPESDCLYEVRGVFPQELHGGEVNDVSGDEKWEKRFADQQSGKVEEL